MKKQITCAIMKNRKIACDIMEKRQATSAIMKKRQIACTITTKCFCGSSLF